MRFKYLLRRRKSLKNKNASNLNHPHQHYGMGLMNKKNFDVLINTESCLEKVNRLNVKIANRLAQLKANA